MNCPKCNAEAHKNGIDRGRNKQKYRCPECGYHFREQAAPSNNKTMGISLNDFKKQNDPWTQVRDAVAKLERGTLYKRQEFVKIFGIRAPGIREIISDPEFDKYRGNTNAETQYLGHPEDIAQLKNEMLLR